MAYHWVGVGRPIGTFWGLSPNYAPTPLSEPAFANGRQISAASRAIRQLWVTNLGNPELLLPHPPPDSEGDAEHSAAQQQQAGGFRHIDCLQRNIADCVVIDYAPLLIPIIRV